MTRFLPLAPLLPVAGAVAWRLPMPSAAKAFSTSLEEVYRIRSTRTLFVVVSLPDFATPALAARLVRKRLVRRR